MRRRSRPRPASRPTSPPTPSRFAAAPATTYWISCSSARPDPATCASASAVPELPTDRLLLQCHELLDAAARKAEHLEERLLGEGGALGRALHLDDAALAGQHEIGIGVGV